MTNETDGKPGSAPKAEPVETHYDDEPKGASCSRLRVLEAACEMGEQVRDEVLKRVPVDVAEHLAASRKELLRAGIALAEAHIRKTDEMVGRARDLHAQSEA